MFNETAIAAEREAVEQSRRAAWERTLRHLLAEWGVRGSATSCWRDGLIVAIGLWPSGLVMRPGSQVWDRLAAAGAPMAAEPNGDTERPPAIEAVPCPLQIFNTAWGPIARRCVHDMGHTEHHEWETIERAAVRTVAEILHVAEARVAVSWLPTDGERPSRIDGVSVDGVDLGENHWNDLLTRCLPMLSWEEAQNANAHRRALERQETPVVVTQRLLDAVDAVTSWPEQAPADLRELARRIGELDAARRASA